MSNERSGAMEPAVLDWLLERDDPSVRYRTLVDLLDSPADDAAVLEGRARIPENAAVRKIFGKMHPDGYWLNRGKGDGVAYANSASTHFVLAFLAELGMDRSDARIAKAVERYLSLQPPDRPNLRRWEIPPDYRNHQSCLYAYNLRTFVMLGYRDDPRVQQRTEVLLKDVRSDGGYLCDRPSFTVRTKSCIRGSIKALTAFAALPELWSTSRCQDLIDYFLRRRVFFRMSRPQEVIRGELTRTAFPFSSNGSLLEPLYALSVMGYGQHPALQEAWAQLETKRDTQGRYILDSHPTTPFDPGPKGQGNKWVTLYAYLALKHAAAKGC
jgi:hypothetical protein